MRHAIKYLFLVLTLLPGLPAMADSKDVCWEIENADTNAGTLRLRVVHSIANEHFVLSGVRELGDDLAYPLTGAAVRTGSTYTTRSPCWKPAAAI